jgi:hypothetical protein
VTSEQAANQRAKPIAAPAANGLIEDDGLIAAARTQWQFGDWSALAQIKPETMENHPHRALLALLSAAGHLQLGHVDTGRTFMQLALSVGCDTRTAVRLLISGVYNSLGRAAAINRLTTPAAAHFAQCIELSPFRNDSNLIAQARAREQLRQVKESLRAPGSLTPEGTANPAPGNLKVQQLAAFDLGQAWSGNTVNTVIFRHHGILTWGGNQYTAFYVDEGTLRVVRRTLTTNHIATHDIAGQYNLRDAHNSISLGIDRAGYLHISYDHHATKLRYRRSSQPNAIAEWTDELTMTGADEDRVTYPTFILPRANHPLTMLYRDGGHNKGSARLKTYDEQTKSWTDRPTPILSGAEHKPWTSNAYWNHPAIGSDGSLHLSFVWRTDTIGEQQLVNNVNIGYAWSPDNGVNWFTSRGQACKLPMTQVNAETVWPVSPGSNLINQTSMALDSHNRPHIVFYADDSHGIPQYQYICFDGIRWNHQYFSWRTEDFELKGQGTLQIPICRPEILIAQDDQVLAIFRGDLTNNRMSIVRLTASSSSYNSTSTRYEIGAIVPLCANSVGFAEPVIDRMRWSQAYILTMLLQHNNQPDGDATKDACFSPITLVDFQLI